MMNRAKQSLTNKKGMTSIIITIILLIGVGIVAALVDFSAQIWAVREAKGIMDMAGVNTITTTINKGLLKDEYFGFTETSSNEALNSRDDSAYSKKITGTLRNKMIQTYQNQLISHFSSSRSIGNIEIVNFDVSVNKDKWGSGTDTSKNRPYIMIDVVVTIDINAVRTFTAPPRLHSGSFAGHKDGGFTVTDITSPDRNTIRVVARSVVRGAYR